MMNGYDRNFDYLDYLVGIQQDQRRTGVSGNNVAIYQFLGVSDGLTATDGGCVIAPAQTGCYDIGKYNSTTYGA